MSPLGKELDGLIFLGLVVVLVHGDGELDFLDDDDLLLLLGGAFALFLLVEEAAVVLDAADGRNGVGRNFHQVEAALAGDLQSFKWRQDAELLAVFVDDADFAGANAIVDADKRLGRTFIECDGTPPDSCRAPASGSFRNICRGARTHPEYSTGLMPGRPQRYGLKGGFEDRLVRSCRGFELGIRRGSSRENRRCDKSVAGDKTIDADSNQSVGGKRGGEFDREEVFCEGAEVLAVRKWSRRCVQGDGVEFASL